MIHKSVSLFALILATVAVKAHVSTAAAGPHSHDEAVVNISINPENGPNPWTNLLFNNDPGNFQFAIITDRTCCEREGILFDAVKKLNLLQPEFVMSVGDLIEGYTENRKQVVAEWEEFDMFVEMLEMPFFYVAGNHDYTNPVMAEIWKERLGKSYYHFTYQDVLFVMLNSNDAGHSHHMTAEQVDWLEGVLKENPNPRWTLVFIHAPLWDRKDANRWPEMEALLQGRDYTVFAGHHHSYVKQKRMGKNYYTLATTGGGSQMRGPRFGEFDHVLWVTMTDNGPVLANLLLDGIWPDTIRTEEMRDYQRSFVENTLRLTPILYRGDFFESGSTELRLVNDSDIPYTVALDLMQTANVNVQGRPDEPVRVDPNEVERIPLSFSDAGAAVRDAEIARLDWELSYELKGETVSYAGSDTLTVIREYPIPRVTSVTVDGDLGDWESLPYIAESSSTLSLDKELWKNKKDASFRFAVGADSEYLYFAVKALDPERMTNPNERRWMRDGIEITVDARPENKRLNNRTDYGSNGFFRNDFHPDASGRGGFAADEEGLQGTRYALSQNRKGYTLEVAVPHAVMDAMAGGDWEGARINVVLTDRDPEDLGKVAISWKPVWNAKQALPGDGSFYRE